MPRKPVPPKQIVSREPSNGKSTRKILTHPLFTPVQISTRTPLLETDYNFHKSNSTYFSDLDVSRTKLMTRIISPGFKKVNAQLEEEGHRGRMVVALGAVHVTFRKEIGIFEKVWVRSRLLGWDEKWAIIVSYFVRTKKGRVDGTNGPDKGEELCAVGLSKYVVKKGRFTVKPDRILRMGGWLPKKQPDQAGSETCNGEIKLSLADVQRKDDEAEDAEEGLESAQTPAIEGRVVLDEKTAAAAESAAHALSVSDADNSAWDAEAWDWEEIEEERLRGLKLAKTWLALDGELCEEFDKN
ncbi:hypothetical protein EPUS_06827 [Endocarpon pusillum Z07020]|uniref:Thioesterase domain-containing protein n=1 Tax=Endocarpon pusillum (strain Z07020 / HMAS-L-300199) TaxID=1263415 RepID=U1HMB2_ENDPU|nr:uncharacterized protein EPUS_06827 [Endocarpon pusillum Z07020]ERF71445.1 hypothetical protein EPUS_06827 [Endocarpon pusillum Z07020]